MKAGFYRNYGTILKQMIIDTCSKYAGGPDTHLELQAYFQEKEGNNAWYDVF